MLKIKVQVKLYELHLHACLDIFMSYSYFNIVVLVPPPRNFSFSLISHNLLSLFSNYVMYVVLCDENL
jgi:hypothetical protein